MEYWKDIKDYEGLYQVSDKGRVRSLGRQRLGFSSGDIYLKPVEHRGYKRVELSREGKRKKFYVHRLVALAFLSNSKGLDQVNHIDGNKSNNDLSNLEWISARDNVLHASKVLNRRGGRKRELYVFDRYYNLILQYDSIREAARRLRIHPRTLYSRCKREKQFEGFTFALRDLRQDRGQGSNEIFNTMD